MKPHARENDEFTGLSSAWVELSRDAFAVWTMLMIVPGTTLDAGRTALAASLDMPVRTLNRILRELRNKAYVRVVPARAGNSPRHATIVVLRRARLPLVNRFLRP